MPVASVTQAILDATEAALVAALGTGSGATHEITTANIIQGKLPWGDGMGLPGILLTPVAEMEQDATNASDDIGYGVQVTICQASNRNLTANADRLYYWRETAAAVFRNKQPSTVANTKICKIEPRPAIDPAAFTAQFDATAFVVRWWVRTTRP